MKLLILSGIFAAHGESNRSKALFDWLRDAGRKLTD